MVIDYIPQKVSNTWESNLRWQCQVSDLSIKLNRDNVFLFKIRKYVSPKILRSIYFAIFKFHLSYCSLVWAQNCRTIQQIVNLQKKGWTVWIINFQPRNFHTSVLFKESSILKFQDKICSGNILFVSKPVSNLTLSVFNNGLTFLRINITLKPQVLDKVTL